MKQKHNNTLAGFLGFAPRKCERDFSETHEAAELEEVSFAPISIVNPCTGLPIIEGSVIDVAGNVYGTGCNLDSSIAIDAYCSDASPCNDIEIHSTGMHTDDSIFESDLGLNDGSFNCDIDCSLDDDFGSDW